MEISRGFLDSSVLVAALMSATGGSFHILTSLAGKFKLQINHYVLKETQRAIGRKFSMPEETKRTLFFILGSANIEVLSNPSEEELKRLNGVISKKDAPILAAALKYSDYLITLDKEFFNEKVQKLTKTHNLVIMRPGEFVEKFKT